MFAKTRFRYKYVPISTILPLKGRRISFVMTRTSLYIVLKLVK